MSKTGKICTALVAAVYGIGIAHDAVLFGLGELGRLEFALNAGVTTVIAISYVAVVWRISRRDKDDGSDQE